MALSATISTPVSVAPAGYLVNCNITISNSGSSAVTIKQIRSRVKSTPISFLEDKSSFTSFVSLPPGAQVPAGGSLQVLMQVIFHGANNGGSYDVQNVNGTTYDLGCNIFAADGSVTVPTPATITITQNSQEI